MTPSPPKKETLTEPLPFIPKQRGMREQCLHRRAAQEASVTATCSRQTEGQSLPPIKANRGTVAATCSRQTEHQRPARHAGNKRDQIYYCPLLLRVILHAHPQPAD